MLRNKRGSVTILILLIFLSLISAVTVFINVSKKLAVKSTTKELGLVWCEAILGEYDLNLQGRYGIFAFDGIESDINEKIDFYAHQSFLGKKYIAYQGANCSLYNYSLGNLSCFKRQIVKEGKCAVLNKNNGIREIKAAKNAKTISPSKVEFKDLPSSENETSMDIKTAIEILKKLKSLNKVVKSGSEAYFEKKYIEKYFKNHSSDKKLGRTYFNLEEEYILNGKTSDDENRKSTKRKLILLRSTINLVYLQTDKEKHAETLAAAEALTPGPWAVATQKALQAAWAVAEARNDYMLLVNGKKVPFYKTKDSWATDLKSLTKDAVKKMKSRKKIEKDKNKESKPQKEENSLSKSDFNTDLPYIEMDNYKGEVYEDYISAMIFLMREETKLLRIMDLIEINMKTMYYGGFRVRDYNSGVKAGIKVNGGICVVKKEYTPK